MRQQFGKFTRKRISSQTTSFVVENSSNDSQSNQNLIDRLIDYRFRKGILFTMKKTFFFFSRFSIGAIVIRCYPEDRFIPRTVQKINAKSILKSEEGNLKILIEMRSLFL